MLFQLHFYWTFSFLGSQDGCKAIRKEVWNQRCKLKKLFSYYLFNHFKVKEWLKDNDADNDGRLSYMEFKKSLKKFLNLGGDDGKEEENGE